MGVRHGVVSLRPTRPRCDCGSKGHTGDTYTLSDPTETSTSPPSDLRSSRRVKVQVSRSNGFVLTVGDPRAICLYLLCL